MKVMAFGGAWLFVGALVAARNPQPPLVRGLILFFWPFFVVDIPEKPSAIVRLRSAMHSDDPANSLVGELENALERMHARQVRLGRALRELEGTASSNVRSRVLLQDAHDQYQQEFDAVIAAIEETATRLILAREAGSHEEVSALLGALHARMMSVLEVSQTR